MNPHAGQLYSLANNLHFSQRHNVTAPHLGQSNFTAFSSGVIFLPHDMHVAILFSYPSSFP
jgi:hypothetical protein